VADHDEARCSCLYLTIEQFDSAPNDQAILAVGILVVSGLIDLRSESPASPVAGIFFFGDRNLSPVDTSLLLEH
jgi:hypothetical protein